MPAVFAGVVVAGLTASVIEGTTPGFGFRSAGLLALLIWIAVRAAGTVAINSATLSWRPDALPENWRELIDRAE